MTRYPPSNNPCSAATRDASAKASAVMSPSSGSDVAQGGEVSLGHDKDVNRRLRMEIVESDVVLALGNELGTELAAGNAAEDTVVYVFGDPVISGSLLRIVVDRHVVRSQHPPFVSAGIHGSPASMPELPEVETVRRSLVDKIVGQRISALRVGDFHGVLAAIVSRIFSLGSKGRDRYQSIRRRGKYLIIDLDDDTAIVVHLRMTGRSERGAARGVAASLRAPGDRVRATVSICASRTNASSAGSSIAHGDDLDRLRPRWVTSHLRRGFIGDLARTSGCGVGPAKSRRSLLDQGLIGGLGNIYVDEALFRAGIHPERRGELADVRGSPPRAPLDPSRAARGGR